MLDVLHSICAGRLLDQTVDVWLVDPAALWDASKGELGMLGGEERRRLNALRRERDRILFGMAHVFLRRVLSAYARCHRPEQWCFEREVRGRPAVRADLAHGQARGLRFSLSHTDGLVAVAVSRDWPVGVDVESLQRPLELPSISPALLADAERPWFDELPEVEQRTAFLNLWTMKEALLKAHGVGIADGLNHIALVNSLSDPRAVLVRAAWAAAEETWHVMLACLRGHGAKDQHGPPAFAFGLAVGGCLTAWSAPARAKDRQVAVFDLRREPPARDAAVLADALFLPVREVAAVMPAAETT
jgi:phosphopantetheinyl transferase